MTEKTIAPYPSPTETQHDPFEGWVIQPEPSEAGRAAAIIAGHDKIMALGVDGATEFHGFVQEVLATTVEPELVRLRRQIDDEEKTTLLVMDKLKEAVAALEKIASDEMMTRMVSGNQRTMWLIARGALANVRGQ